ncbi:MAG TPA: hypothetical protein PK765_01580 [bacterium]|nr:hypothetical protein [bacterium]
MQWSTNNSTWHDLTFSGDGFVTDSWTFEPDSQTVYVRAYKNTTAAVLGIARMIVTYKTRLVGDEESGPFSPQAFTLDNSGLSLGSCGNLNASYTYANSVGTGTGSFSIPYNGSVTKELPGLTLADSFTLYLSSPDGDVCIDKLDIVSGGVVPEETYEGDVVRYACETEQYSCEWSDIVSCGSEQTCYVDGDYCRVKPEYLGVTAT